LSIHVGKCKRRRSVRATQSCESVEKWINNPPKPAMWISACAVCGICRGCAETVLCSRACVCGGGKTVCACCVHCVCRGCSETVYVRAYAAGFPKLSARALPCMCEIRVRVLCALRVRARCVYAVCAVVPDAGHLSCVHHRRTTDVCACVRWLPLRTTQVRRIRARAACVR
jgi:hypothetical protein